MDILLDTHAFLWWRGDDARLGPKARGHLGRPGNTVYVSAATTWEIAVKRALGKLKAPGEIAAWLAEEGFVPLPIDVAHTVGSAELPWHHRDPFDRLLIAQAQQEDLTLMARDDRIALYDVALLDAGE